MVKETIEQLIEGGRATAGPPLGPAIGPLGLNINEVVNAINQKTQSYLGMKVSVKVIVDTDTKKYEVEVGTPPTSGLIKKELGIEKISYAENAPKYDLKFDQLLNVAKMKEASLLSKNFNSAVKEVAGVCTSLGITIEGLKPKEFIKKFDAGEFKVK